MKKVECILRPEKFETVKEALGNYGVKGMTVTHVVGCGLQQGRTEVYRGNTYNINLLPKIKIEIVVADEEVESIIDLVLDKARTGHIGDGKIFVSPVEDAIRIRTGERGSGHLT